MKLGILVAIVISFASLSANATRTEMIDKSFTYSVEAKSKSALLEKVQTVLSSNKLGEKNSAFDCYAVRPYQVNVSNVEVSKKYSVDANNKLNPYYVAKINYSQEFDCIFGGDD